MRSIILLLFAGGTVTGASAAPWMGAPPPGVRCADDPATHFARPGRDGQFRRLTELPPAEAYLAVFHRGADGCMIPVKVGDRQGAPGRQAPARPPRR